MRSGSKPLMHGGRSSRAIEHEHTRYTAVMFRLAELHRDDSRRVRTRCLRQNNRDRLWITIYSINVMEMPVFIIELLMSSIVSAFVGLW